MSPTSVENEHGGRSRQERAYQLRVLDASKGPYMDFPMRVGIETHAVCNASCDFCPYPTMTRKGERMDDVLLEKVLDDLSEIPSDVSFGVNPTRISEPLLDKRMLGFLEELNRRYANASIIFFTNGQALTSKTLARMASLKNYHTFNISFNDHRESEYERVMQISFEKTCRALDGLHEAVVSGEFGVTPRLSRVGDGTEADEGFKAWCKERWPAFRPVVRPRMDWMGKVDTTFFTDAPPVSCMQWFTLQVLANGRDAFCCVDHDAEFGFGDVREMSIVELYNHPERRKLRSGLPSRHDVETCRTCRLLG